MTDRARQGTALVALLATALVSGAFVAVVGASFIWVVEHGTHEVWVHLPQRLGVEPFTWWWIVLTAAVGGVAVGILQRTVGDHPRPLEEAIGRWRGGGRVEPGEAPRTAVNALVVLVMGGPVGFEAALVGLLGGTAAFVAERIRSVGSLVRQVWGAERIGSLPHRVRQAPYWLAAISSVLTFRLLPFGGTDLGFRFGSIEGEWGVAALLAVFGLSAVIALPAVLALRVVAQAEASSAHQRAPVLAAVAGGLAFAVLALGDHGVLFSGQLDYQHLQDATTAHLLYLTVAKWLALVIALFAGWRGGPIFPLFTSAGAFAVVAAGVIGVDANLLMVGSVASVSTVVATGRIPLACVLAFYVVPLSLLGVVLVGCLGAAAALAVAGALGDGER